MLDLYASLANLFHPRHSNSHRARVLHPKSYSFYAILLIWVAITLHFLPSLPQMRDILGFASSITPEQVVAQTNATRRSQGLSDLVYSTALSEAASAKAADMLEQQYWAHESPDGKQPWTFIAKTGYQYRSAGENLARDFSNTSDMVQAWVNSPTHRANLMSKKFTEIGVAVVHGQFGGYETTLVVQMFATPKQGQTRINQLGDTLVESEPIKAITNTEVTLGAMEYQLQPATIGPAVLAGSITSNQLAVINPILSPQLVLKVIGGSLVAMLIATLCYDCFWLTKKEPHDRLVGQNMAHIVYLLTIAVLIALYRSGMV